MNNNFAPYGTGTGRSDSELKRSTDIVIAGVGGQGTVLASKLLANAAMLAGIQVRCAETIGMAQRGGSVLGHVRMSHQPTSDHQQLSPQVPLGQADVIIGFEPAETLRALSYLKEGGTVVTAKRGIASVIATLAKSDGQASYDGRAHIEYLKTCSTNGRIGKLIVVDGDAACTKLGSTKVLNMVLLGAATHTNSIHISQAAIESALAALVKPQYLKLNEQALQEGASWVI